MAVARDARLVADGVTQGLAERDADILDGVVVVDVQVAGGLKAQVQQAVAGDVGEHVVEEADAGDDLAPAVAVEVDAEGDIGLRCPARDLGLPGVCMGQLYPSGLANQESSRPMRNS